MTTDKGIALSRLLFWSAIFITVAGISLPLFVSPVQAADQDQDGLSDAFENGFGSDPNDANTDHDGYSDWDEIYVYGTDPSNPDTDGDGTPDDQDPEPLDDGTDAGGRTTPSRNYSANLPSCPVPSSSAQVGLGVDATTGGMRVPLATSDFGMGTNARNVFRATCITGIQINDIFGRNIITNWTRYGELQGNGDYHVVTEYGLWVFAFNGGNFDPPSGVMWTLVHDEDNDLFVMTAMVGGAVMNFGETSGDLQTFGD